MQRMRLLIFNPLNAKGVYIRPSMVISVTTNAFHGQPRAYIYMPLVVCIMNTWSLHMLHRDVYIRPWLLMPKQRGIQRVKLWHEK